MDIDLKTFNFKELREYLYEYSLKKIENDHLFHYTSLEALTNILKTNTLWATHCKYLNDLMELRDFERLYNKLINTKENNFKYENEFRMAFTLEDKDVGNIEIFRIKNNLVIPYIAVEFKYNGKIPIKSITINPEQKDCMYEESIKYLLRSYNYDIPINHSSSKLR